MNTTRVPDRFAPQMADYERLGAQADWRPFVMFFHQPNFRSRAVNTDQYGFRLSHDPTGRAMTLGAAPGPVSLVVGNSTAFGVGATDDGATLASQLSSLSGRTWLNFAGRAFGCSQELLLFQFYQGYLSNIDEVVIFSGSNDLYLYFQPKQWDDAFGAFSYSDRFFQNMREDLVSLSPKRDFLRSTIRLLTGRRVDARTVALRDLRKLLSGGEPATKSVAGTEILRERMADRQKLIGPVERALSFWKLLATEMGFRLRYVLQPIQPWVGHRLAPEEHALMEYWSENGSKSVKYLDEILRSNIKDWYIGQISNICERLSIPFLDMNSSLLKDGDGVWLFIDHLHMTNECNRRAAKLILNFS